MNHICKACGEEYIPRRSSSNYCSRKCYDVARKINVDESKIIQLYNSGYSQVEVATMVGVTQPSVCLVLKRNGTKARPARKRNQYRENNASWKGGTTIDQQGYRLVLCPNHPRTTSRNKYVQEHVLIMEQHLGRYLIWKGPGHPESEIVHHINGDKLDNRLENLEVVTFVQHMKLHNNLHKRGDEV